MNIDTIKGMLTRLCGEAGKEGAFQLKGADHALLVASQGALMTVAKVVSVALHDGFVEATTARGERYLLEAGVVVGFKTEPGAKEGTGFLSK